MGFENMTHEAIELRRENLRNSDTKKHLELKNRRYAMFRMQNFLEGGSAPEAEHVEAYKKIEEDVKPLGGALKFAKKWDFDPATGEIVIRDRSIWKAHEEFMEKAAPTLGSKEAMAMESSISRFVADKAHDE